MTRPLLNFVLCLFVSLTACAPAVTSSPPTPTPYLTATPPAILPSPGRVVIASASLTLVSDDPSRTLLAIQGLIQDSGGVVLSASYYSAVDYGYANLSARVPPAALSQLLREAAALDAQIQSENVYSQDVTSEYRELQGRLVDLHTTEDRLWGLLTQTDDRGLADSLSLVRDLVKREIEGVVNQLANYDDRSALATLDVTVNVAQPAPVILEE